MYDIFALVNAVCVRSYDRPKMIQSLQGKHVKDIACGSSYSAAITSNGELYTWGDGAHGRLGHGDKANQPKPKQVCKQGGEMITMAESNH